jgi:hypothetical protein
MLKDSLALGVNGSWRQQAAPNRWWSGALTYSQEYALLVTVALPRAIVWAKSRTLGGAPLNVSFHLHDLGHHHADTQVMLRIGDGWAEKAIVVLPRPEYLPETTFPLGVLPHVWTELFRVEAEPIASVGLLAIPRSSVRMGRTGVWRPRAELHRDIGDELHDALHAGRHGILQRRSAG